MKTLKTTVTVLFFSTAMLLSSCSSDDGGSGGNAGSGVVTAKVNGTSVSSVPLLSQASKVTAGSTSTLNIQATNMEGKGYSFNINNFTGVGTYDIGGASSVFVTASYIEGNATNPLATNIWSAPYDNTNLRGTISFATSTNDNITGTFEFSCKNPNDDTVKQVTEGSFNLPVTNF